ncbi:LuxR family transcriptional regulator [Salinifilum aidingensis]
MSTFGDEIRYARDALAAPGGGWLVAGGRAVGKTALLRDVAEHARTARGAEVLWAAGGPTEARAPGAVAGALLGAEVRPGDPVRQRLAERAPVLLVVDDAHRVDSASAELLAHLARGARGRRVWVVLAADARARLPAGLARLPRRDLSGVDESGAAGIVPAARPAVRTEMLRLARGNPLVLREFAAELGEAELAGSAPLPRQVRLGPAGRAVFAPDWDVLDGSARTWLLLLAHGPPEYGACARAAAEFGLGPDELAPAERAGVVRGAEWAEPLTAAAVRHAGTTAETERVCSALVRALDADEWPVARARALAGAVRAPERAATELAAATVPLARGGHLLDAHAAAVRATELAAERSDRDRYRIIAAELAWLAGYSEHALRLLDRAEPRGADARTSAAVIRAVIHGFRDSWTRGWWLLPTEPDPEPGGAEHAFRLLVTVINAGWNTVSVDSLHRAVRRLRGAVEPGFAAAVGALEQVLDGNSAPVPEHSAALRELAWWARPSDALHPKSWPPPLLPMFLGEEEDYARLFSALLDSEAVLGAPSTRALLLLKTAAAELALGRWDRAAEHAVAGAELAEELGHHALRADSLLCRAWIAAARGAEEHCTGLVDAALRCGEDDANVREPAMVPWVRGLAALTRGRPGEACEHLRWAVRDPATPQRATLRRLATADYVDAAVRAGAGDEAAAAVEDFAGWVERGAAAWARQDLALCRALLAGDDADEWYARALELAADSGRVLCTGRVELRYGAWLRRRKQEQRARAYLRAAEGRFERLGAEEWRRAAHAELRASGETHQSDPGAPLTPQEREIALLAAEGMTNRQIAAKLALSPRTVGYHLYKVFPKLDITSRAQLAHVLDRD